jgi:hypothetical protein
VKRVIRKFLLCQHFLLIVRIVDTVLLVNFKEEGKAKRKREEKVKVSAVFKA